jgi:hypothetical protein
MKLAIVFLLSLTNGSLLAFALDNLKLLILGSAGFFGYHLTSLASDKSVDVVATDSLLGGLNSASYKYKRSWDLLLSRKIETRTWSPLDEEGAYLRNALRNNERFSHVINLGEGDSDGITDDFTYKYLHQVYECLVESFEYGASPVLVHVIRSSRTSRKEDPSSFVEKMSKDYFVRHNISSLILRVPEVVYLGIWPPAKSSIFNLHNLTYTPYLRDRSGEAFTKFIFMDDLCNQIFESLLNSTSCNGVIAHSLVPKMYERKFNDFLHYIQHKEDNGNRDVFYSKMHPLYNWLRHNLSSMTPLPCASECSSSSDCYHSGFDEAAKMSTRITDGCDVVFYTVSLHRAQSGLMHVDTIMNAKCYIAFVKRSSPLGQRNPGTLNGWNVVVVSDYNMQVFGVSRRASRLPKISPASFFAKTVQYAVYFDTGGTPKIRPDALDQYMRSDEKRVAIAMLYHRFQVTDWHHVRSPVQEINHILKCNNSALASELVKQRDAYQAASNLNNNLRYRVMPVGSFIIHDLLSVQGSRFRCNWLNEYLQWGDRDQPPLYYVLAKYLLYRTWEHSTDYFEFVNIGGHEYLRMLNYTNTKGALYLPFFEEGATRGYNMALHKNSGRV